MSTPNIDTFEHDISEEIKAKEATIGDIASAGGDIGNTPVPSSSAPTLLVALGIIFFVAVLITIGVFFYKYSNQKVPVTVPRTDGVQHAKATGAGSVSYILDQAVGASIGTTQKSEHGYALQVLSYPEVFAYMIKNEQQYADEVARAVGSPRDTSTTTPNFSFTDVTINNQNMRVGTSGSSTIVYAFVNAQTLLISSSTSGILALRNDILH